MAREEVAGVLRDAHGVPLENRDGVRLGDGHDRHSYGLSRRHKRDARVTR